MTRATTLEFPRPTLSTPDPKTLAAEILKSLNYRIGKDAAVATQYDWLTAAISVVRDRIIDSWIESTKAAYDQEAKRVYYLSLEFLIGRLMRDAFSNLGLIDAMREALESLGVDLDVIAALEPDAALGNGGLGRLAACFMESMATVDIPAYGYGIRYVNGMFRQQIADGWQVELPETWLAHGNPWEFERRERAYRDRLRRLGRVDHQRRRPPGAPCLESGRSACWPSPTTRRSSAGAASASTRCGCGRRMPIDPILLDAFNRRRPHRRAGRKQQGRGAHARALSRRFARRPDRNCGCARNISSPPPRCRTSCAATSSSTATCRRWPTRRRSSSTTPIRPSRSPNSCAC